uniref:Trichohyalin-like n=1 Tax=Callorhinchus milii TaxID=7868 RepID=A0A4W3GC57_CALMI
MAEKRLSRHSRRTARRRRELPEEPGENVGRRDEAYMIQKVREFFHEVGGDDRGSITRTDMQTLQAKFGFSPQDLEVVFDKLDVHGNGYLTREELTDQLSHFLTDQNQGGDEDVEQQMADTSYQSQGLQQQVQTEDEEKQHFEKLVERLGATVISEHRSEMWKLWVQIRREEPNLLGLLEDFMAKVTSQIQESQQEKEEVEKTLKRRVTDHNTEVQRLYEEMEQQIASENERFQSELRREQDVTLAENEKLKLSNRELEIQLQETRNQLVAQQQEAERLTELNTEVQRLNQEMEQQISSEDERFQSELQALHREQDVTLAENEKLKLNNQELEIQLQETRNQLVAQQQEAERVNTEVQRLNKEAEPQISSENESLQSELQTLRREQDATLAENEKLKLNNQELEIQLQETRNQLVAQQQQAE